MAARAASDFSAMDRTIRLADKKTSDEIGLEEVVSLFEDICELLY